MNPIESFFFHFGAFCAALILCLIGVFIAEEIRKMKRRFKARNEPKEETDQTDQDSRGDSIRQTLQRRQTATDRYMNNQSEIDRRIDQENQDTFEWSLENPADPVARRHLDETRQRLVEHIGHLEHVRVPVPVEFESVNFDQARRDQDLTKLNAMEAKVDRIDQALATLADNKP